MRRDERRVGRARRALVAALTTLALLLASGGASADVAGKKAADPDPWFGRDKALHFTFSALIAGGAYVVTSMATPSLAARASIGAGVGFGAGVAKELVDLAGYGDPSWRDLTWDAIGTATGVGVALSIDAANRHFRSSSKATDPRGATLTVTFRF